MTRSIEQNYPLKVTQDGELLGNDRFIRRTFGPDYPLEQPQQRNLQINLTSSQSSSDDSQSSSSLSIQLSFERTTARQNNAPELGRVESRNRTRAEPSTSGQQLPVQPRAAPRGHHTDGENSPPNSYDGQKTPILHQMPPQKADQETSSNQRCTQPNEDIQFTYEKLVRKTHLGTIGQSFVIAKRTRRSNNGNEIAIRIRTGTAGYSEWINELQVYLIPKFKHENILDHLGSEQSRKIIDRRKRFHDNLPKISDIRRREYLLDSLEEARANRCREILYTGPQIRMQYWLLNRFDDSVLLRDYLRENVLTWPQMLYIAKGIINGLNYLHENSQYQGIDTDKATDRFIKSTRGALKKVAFLDSRSMIHMKPYHACSVIHRNLTSLNIILKKSNLNPCIWNFGHSRIYHPFQPTNFQQIIDGQFKSTYLSSPYSAPEVLDEKGYLTLPAMKAIDIYACAIIYWELLSRCSLPKLEDRPECGFRERTEPGMYQEPFEEEFNNRRSSDMLRFAVCKLRARPSIKPEWSRGKKSNKFVQTIQDMWDHEFEARLQASTVIDRLARLSPRDCDMYQKYAVRYSPDFKLGRDWPPALNTDQLPVFADKFGPNIQFID